MGGPVGAHTRTEEPEPRPPPGEGNKFEQRRPAPFHPPLVPAPGRIPTGQAGRGRRGPLPQRKVQPVQARGRRGRGRGKSPSGRGVNPAAPRPALGGGRGTLAP